MLHKAQVGGCSPSGIHPRIDGDKIGERIPREIIKWDGIRTLAFACHVLHTSIRHQGISDFENANCEFEELT